MLNEDRVMSHGEAGISQKRGDESRRGRWCGESC